MSWTTANSKKQKSERKICKYVHCEFGIYGFKFCCEKHNEVHCKFDSLDSKTDYSKCEESVLVSSEEWEKHAAKMGWYR